MKSSGILSYHSESYFLLLNDKKYCMEWFLYSSLTADDRYKSFLGEELLNDRITDINLIFSGREDISNYLLGSIKYNKTSGKSELFGDCTILLEVISTLGFCKNYKFKPSNILNNNEEIIGDTKVKEFYGLDNQLSYRIREENKYISFLSIEKSGVSISLNFTKKRFPSLNIIYKEASRSTSTEVAVSSVDALDLQALKSVCDLSFCLDENDNFTMDFGAVTNVQEFKNMMSEFKRDIEKGLADKIKVDVGLDTETTGLGVFELNEGNENRDHIVAIPISWRDNQARVIFTDMAYFDNVPMELVKSELGPYITRPDDFFKRDPKFKNKLFQPEKPIETLRDAVNLIGHNMMFDRRAFLNSDIDVYFDEDTLQMSFNLNPTVFRSNNGLKFLEDKLLGYAPPELSDVLGKGNEDKYKYIKDLKVAVIYGCCDANGTRLIKQKLKNIMTEKMYFYYRHQDIPIMNFLAEADWHGIPMNVENISKCADMVESDLEVIHQFLQNYIGVFVDTKNEQFRLKCKMDSDPSLDNEWYNKEVKKIKVNPDSVYYFFMKSGDIRKVLYQILEYPIIAYTKGKNPLPSADKNVLKKFMSKKLNPPSNALKKNVMSKDGERVLIEASEFNKFKYPVAYVLNLYSKMNKDFTSYYKPIRDDNVEGRLFKTTSLSRIETRRIMNPSQTMSKVAKSNVLPPSDDWYMMDFDISQVEIRKMYSRAKVERLIHKMNNPESDAHTETAALMNGVEPHEVNHDQRSNAKSVNFGYPYGLGDFKMCEKLFGEVNDNNLYMTRMVMKVFKENLVEVVNMIDQDRKNSLIPMEMTKELRDFIGAYDEQGNEIPYGAVYNDIGFYRLFSLKDLDRVIIGIIERAAGNYPIQSTAAEIFRLMILRFKLRCYEEGIANKVRWYLTVHDELVFAAHKSVHPFFLYKIIYEECMLKIKDQARYFIGIGAGRTWNEAKSDDAEAPVYFVHRMKKRYEAGEFKETWIDEPWEYVKPFKHQFFVDRIHEVLKELQPDIDENPINYKQIYSNFPNYTVRAYILDNFKCNIPKSTIESISNGNKEEKAELINIGHLQSWALEQYGEGKEMILPNGNKIEIINMLDDSIDLEEQEDINDLYGSEETEEDDSWSFDSDSICGQVGVSFIKNKDFEDEEQLPIKGNLEDAKSFSDLVLPSKDVKLEFVSKIGDTISLDLKSLKQRDFVKKYLLSFKDVNGVKCIGTYCNKYVRFCNVNKDLPLQSLNDKLKSLL